MQSPIDPNDFEPFGQRGVRGLARPAFITACGVAVALSLAMLVRSKAYYDVLWRNENFRRTEVVSAIGRLMITTRTSYRNPQNSGWTYESAEIGNIDDGWQPSAWKTVGLEWGQETFTGFSGRQISQWRLRMKWRSLLGAALVPVVIDAAMKWRRRKRDARVGFDPLAGVAPAAPR